MKVTGKDVWDAYWALRGDPQKPAEALQVRKAHGGWYAWSGRLCRYLLPEALGIQEAKQRVARDRDEAIAALQKERTDDNAAEIEARIREVLDRSVADEKAIDDAECDIPIKPLPVSQLGNLEMNTVESSALVPFFDYGDAA